MRKYVLCFVFLLLLTCLVNIYTVGSPMGLSTYVFADQESRITQDMSDQEREPRNYFFSTVIFVGVLILIWFIFYKIVYPFYLRYYNPTYCKQLFRSLVMLYGLCWITTSFYVLYETGFRHTWLRWVFVFLGVLWFISFLFMMLKKQPDSVV